MDPQQISTDISADLFGENSGSPGGEPTTSAPAIATGSSLPGGEPAGYTPRPLPQAWKKELEPHWAKLPREVHDFVYEREGNVSRGIQTYREGHERWNKLVSPYAKVWESNPDVDPHQLVGNLLQSHVALSYATPEQRREMVREWLKSYNVNPADLIEQTQAASGPDVARLVQEQVDAALAPYRERDAVRTRQEATAYVEKFFSDASNEFASDPEVQKAILADLQRGERDLKAAYDRAIWLVPEVRAKLIAKQTGGGSPPQLSHNLKASGDRSPAPPAPRRGKSIEDTIDMLVDGAFSGKTL